MGPDIVWVRVQCGFSTNIIVQVTRRLWCRSVLGVQYRLVAGWVMRIRCGFSKSHQSFLSYSIEDIRVDRDVDRQVVLGIAPRAWGKTLSLFEATNLLIPHHLMQ